MDSALLGQLARDALILALTLAAPVLLVTWLVSVIGSAVASFTQLQDPQLWVGPRIAAGLLTLWLSAHWMSDRLLRFSQQVMGALSQAAS